MLKRIKAKLQFEKSQRLVRSQRGKLEVQDRTIISQNCIGGVFSHDMGLEFRSPTVNLFIPAADYMKFIMNLEYYLGLEPEPAPSKEYPVGRLGDIELHFVHYHSFQQAQQAWIRRVKRVDLSKVVVLSTDRDGFNGEVFEKWKMISYPKVLFTACRQYADHPDSVYYPEYEKNGCIPDIIPQREFYRDGKLMNTINGKS